VRRRRWRRERRRGRRRRGGEVLYVVGNKKHSERLPLAFNSLSTGLRFVSLLTSKC
jgi:hypothetical protein